MSGQIFQGNHLIAETNDAPLGFEQGGIEVTQAQYDQLVADDNVAEDTNYYITDTKVIMRNNEKYGDASEAVNVAHKQKFWIWDNNLTYTLDFSELWESIGLRYGAQLICYSTGSDSHAPKLHIFAVAATAINIGYVSVTDVGGDAGFSATASGSSITITAPDYYNTAKLLY